MSCVLNRQRASGSGAQGGGFIVENSLRFDGASRLTKTFDADGDSTTTCTISTWIKRSNLTTAMAVFDAGGYEELRLMATTDRMEVYHDGSDDLVHTTQAFRDPTAWFHVVIVFDNTNSTANDRIRIFINGVRVTALDTNTQPALNDAFSRLLLASHVHSIGSISTGGEYFKGYLAEFILLDGTASTDASEFGEYDSNGNWVPIDPSGLTFGTNGFYLNFAIAPGTGNGAGEDVSGNGNHFTEASLAAADKMSDSPTDSAADDIGNYCTLNPIHPAGGGVLTNGNLEFTGAADNHQVGTMPFPTTGKFYFECEQLTNNGSVGICSESVVASGDTSDGGGTNIVDNIGGDGEAYVLYSSDSKTYSSDGAVAYGNASLSVPTTLGVAVDLDNGAIYFADDNTWIDGDGTDNSATVKSEIEAGTTDSAAYTGLSGVYFPFHQAFNTSNNIINFGANGFEFTPPTGFKPLHTGNLPAPAVKDSTKYFQPLAFTGGGTAAGSGGNAHAFEGNSDLQPDLVIVKDRDTDVEWVLADSSLGALKELNPIDNSAVETVAESLLSFNTDGVTLGSDASWNTSSSPNILFGWKEGATSGVGINSGVSHTSGTPTNIAHGLGVAPEMIWAKATSTTGAWYVYHNGLTNLANNFIALDVAAQAEQTLTDAWGNHNSTNSIIDALPSATYSVWSFANVAGFQQIGHYIGNGSANGTFVYTGFRPSYVLCLNIAGDERHIVDAARSPHNPTKIYQSIDYGQAERTSGTQVEYDFLSNGFKLRVDHARSNGSGVRYLYHAMAEHPFGGSGVSQARAR